VKEFLKALVDVVPVGLLPRLGFAVAMLVIGSLVAIAIMNVVRRVVSARIGPQHADVIRKITGYVLFTLVGIGVLHQLGVNLSALMGAAGILTVALGFASKTSASNIISGLFLLGERPFVVGDTLNVGGTIGEVVSINLLSVTLRTYDNLAVRVPNETLLQSSITNITHYPIRRYDVLIGVDYSEDLKHVETVLRGVAVANPVCMDEPQPTFICLGFGDSAVNVQFSVWAAQDNFKTLRNTIHGDIKNAFDAEGIHIPFPRRGIMHVGTPFEVKVV
jgi:small-conductance mechanosensitive channel